MQGPRLRAGLRPVHRKDILAEAAGAAGVNAKKNMLAAGPGAEAEFFGGGDSVLIQCDLSDLRRDSLKIPQQFPPPSASSTWLISW